MGLYDTIICKQPLPLPPDLMELKDVKWSEQQFQTDSLSQTLGEYEIREDGTLWIQEYDVEDRSDPNAEGWERFVGAFTRTNLRMKEVKDFTGEIKFYNYFAYEEMNYDYWIEFVALFRNGMIIGIDLLKFDHDDNTERKEAYKRFAEKYKEIERLKQKWYVKYGYMRYCSVISFLFRVWRRFCSFLPNSYTVETWLKFQ